MLSREQKDRLENLLDSNEVKSVTINRAKYNGGKYESVTVYLEDNMEFTSVADAVCEIVSITRMRDSEPVEKLTPDNQLIHTMYLDTDDEVQISVHCRRDKEVSENVS